ncbi:YidC/Oxa1 family membrane protein insertase [Patescibacteria group bacterium]|nr:YidC/Oxa1 family membrane protein insertase [Patescibacteria group bacterium]MBU1074962.1 YidC/Oxa1 family membrane protein insertase [Patescibacteria group bacterium]MBU1951445.1 YidC/Oxa1 family membrane protein insertase [Patescibacteria group bacterium]
MVEFFYTVLYEPLFNGLIYIYHVLPWKDLGVAIIVLTVLIKLLLYLPSRSSIKSQKTLQETQPKLDAIKKKYKDDREEMGKQLMSFYKENKVNPFSSCLPLLIQLPILIALYRVFFGGLTTDPETEILVADQVEHLYGSLRDIYTTVPIKSMFLGFVDLAEKGNYVLAFIAGGLQFLQGKMMMRRKPVVNTQGSKDEGKAATINRQMLYFMPVITIIFGIQFPAGLTLYWATSTLFQVGQQYFMFRDKKTKTEQPEVIDQK